MDFEFSNEELSFRNELSAWLKEELANRPEKGGDDADAEWA